MATLVLRPNAYHSSSGLSAWSNQDLSTTSSTVVDESTLDTADYNLSSGGDSTWAESIRYSFPNHSTETGVISSVAITAVVYSALGRSMTSCGLVRIGSTDYRASTFAPDVRTQYTHTDTWNTNPATSSAWTWTNIDDLIAGWYVAGSSEPTEKGAAWQWRVYQIYVTVSYTPLPDAPTNVSATENDSSKVVITWTKSSGATKYQVFRDSTGLTEVGDVATCDDTGGAAPVITAGTASATDGTYNDKVVLSLSGESIANGTSYSYTVKAGNTEGWSAASSADTGYRKASSLSYQWQVSAGDSDASYSDISGATTNPYDYTDAPAQGRYYKCKVTSTGAEDAYSSADRGYPLSSGDFIPKIIII